MIKIQYSSSSSTAKLRGQDLPHNFSLEQTKGDFIVITLITYLSSSLHLYTIVLDCKAMCILFAIC